MAEFLSHIYSQVYKSMNTLKRNPFRLSDVLIWPLIFLFTLTFFVSYLKAEKVYLEIIILGMMGWRVIYFLNLEVVNSFVEEHWSKALPHLMVSPITRLEFALGSAVSGVIKSIAVIFIYVIATYLLYGFVIGDWLTFAIAMFFFATIGFSMGLVTLGLGYYMKDEAFNLAFIWPDVIVLLSGVYFSVEAVYPAFMLPYINLLPSTQAFYLLKSMVSPVTANIPLLALLSALWLVAGYLFNGFMFDRARKDGKLTRLG
ncbi:hypothetical protein HY988_07240 [Candidatus Micrarchaeota archaeon]|nr:hypothetical protein [Candidatus Micrarchaeota archaeon]